jgi:hypothetical protein
VADATTDPVIKQYREQISDNDIKILEALNKLSREGGAP